VLARFLEAFNAGDAARMESLYSEDVVLHLTGGRPPLVCRRALREVDEFHAIARPHTELFGVEFHEEGAGRVRVSTTGYSESARTFDSFGLPRVTGLGAADAFVIERGRIVSLRQADFTPVCQELLGASMDAAIAWLKSRDDPRLARMMPGGKIRLDGDTAVLWIDATREWRIAAGWQQDPGKLAAGARPGSGR
jgi:ketosteroid isomerase-like protein